MARVDAQFDERTPTRVSGSIAADERHHRHGLVHGGLATAAAPDRGQKIAIGLSGEPVPPTTRRGVATNMNSQRPVRSQAARRSSNCR
jgi:acyl-coenzyme A thioesterase PaaI-like protein